MEVQQALITCRVNWVLAKSTHPLQMCYDAAGNTMPLLWRMRPFGLAPFDKSHHPNHGPPLPSSECPYPRYAAIARTIGISVTEDL
mmetsp:Transcript_36902/g.75220  ORF Transcript_36902/g.75220 Transcript_36902/m.75220 type:complete len:86 (+) Transcript_36902:197-454(+)